MGQSVSMNATSSGSPAAAVSPQSIPSSPGSEKSGAKSPGESMIRSQGWRVRCTTEHRFGLASQVSHVLRVGRKPPGSGERVGYSQSRPNGRQPKAASYQLSSLVSDRRARPWTRSRRPRRRMILRSQAENTLRWLAGEKQLTHFGREYYDQSISQGPWVGKAAFEPSKGLGRLR